MAGTNEELGTRGSEESSRTIPACRGRAAVLAAALQSVPAGEPVFYLGVAGPVIDAVGRLIARASGRVSRGSFSPRLLRPSHSRSPFCYRTDS